MQLYDFKETQYTYSDTARPTISGSTGEFKAGVQVIIDIGGKQFQATHDPLTGRYSWTPDEDLPDNSYSYSIRTIDRAGNSSLPLQRTLVIDTTPPDAPRLINLLDDVGAHTGSVDIGGKTDDKTPTLVGSAQRGATVYLRDENDQIIGSAVADAETGIWQLEPAQALHDGMNTLTLVTEELFAGKLRSSQPSAPFNIEIAADGGGTIILPPQYVSIINASDNAGSNTGFLSHDSLTDDATPQLHGYANGSSSVIIYYRQVGSDAWIGSEVASVSGQSWDWTPSNALAYGSYEFQASIGNAFSAPFYLNIVSWQDLISRTVIEFAIDNVGSQTGILAPGAITDDTTPELRGRGEANATLWLFSRKDDGTWQALGTTVANSSGIWSYTPAELETGRYEFKASPVNDAASTNNLFTLEIVDPASYVPVIEYAYDDIGVTRGPVFSGATTDDKAPEFVGHGISNSIVYLELSKNGGAWQTGYSVQVAANGVWKIGNFPELTSGNWSVRVHSEGSADYSSEFTLKVAGAVDGSREVVETFENYNNGWIYQGHITAVGMIKEVKYNAAGSTAMTITNDRGNNGSKGLTFSDGGVNEISLELNQQATKFSFFANLDLNFNDGLYVSAYDANNNLVNTRLTFTNSGSQVELTAVDKLFTKVTILSVGFATLDNLKATFTGETNPNATWLNPPRINEVDGTENSSLIAEDNTLRLLGQHHHLDLINHTLDVAGVQTDLHQASVIDLQGAENTLKLDHHVVLQQGEADLFIADGKTQLLVQGGAGDVVQISDLLPDGSDIDSWTQAQGNVTVAGIEYQVYHHQGDDAELLVQQGILVDKV